MATPHQAASSPGRLAALASLALAIVLGLAVRPAGAQDENTVEVTISPRDLWDCTNRQTAFDYPAGEVISTTLTANGLVIGLADGLGDGFSLAAVARIDYDGGSQRALYQLHNGIQQSGILDPATGTPISGTERQVTYREAPGLTSTVTISHTGVISERLDLLFDASGGVVAGFAIDGQMPPIQPGDPSIYVQLNTFYLPTADAARACGEYLVYFTPAGQAQIGLADGIHDGLLCNSGVEPFSVPDAMDLTHAGVTLDQDAGVYTFTLDFGRVAELNQPFAGGVELYDPTAELPPIDPNWLFNYTGNWSFNFGFTPPSQLDLFASRFIDGRWTPFDNPGHSVSIEGNMLKLDIPFDLLGKPVADWTWFATVTNFSICDQVGLGGDLLPELPVPEPRVQEPEAQPSATATETSAPPGGDPAASATPTATATATTVTTVAPPAAEADSPEREPEGISLDYWVEYCGGSALLLGLAVLAGHKWDAVRKRFARDPGLTS